jgi:hypothetical protein
MNGIGGVDRPHAAYRMPLPAGWLTKTRTSSSLSLEFPFFLYNHHMLFLPDECSPLLWNRKTESADEVIAIGELQPNPWIQF